MSKRSILLLDDDVEVLNALERFLRKRGYAVTATAWPTEAVSLIAERKGQFDVMITDLRMPVINGFMLTRAVREANPGMAVIMLSAFVSADNRNTAKELGAVACLEKPVNTAKLLSAIEHTVPESPE
jgi:CheY-like chemotaxis protein